MLFVRRQVMMSRPGFMSAPAYDVRRWFVECGVCRRLLCLVVCDYLLLSQTALPPEWQKLARKELKGKQPNDLIWDTPEVCATVWVLLMRLRACQ